MKPLKEILREYIQYLNVRYTRKTTENYIMDIKQFLQFLIKKEIKLYELQKVHIENFIIELAKQKNKPASINRKLASIRNFLDFLQERNYVPSNPAKSVKNLRIDSSKIVSAIPRDTLIKFQKHIDRLPLNTKMAIVLMTNTGLRVSELFNLNKNALINKNGNYHLLIKGKGRKERLIPLNSAGYEAFEFLILRGHIKEVSYHKIYKALKKINKSLHPHVLRHTFATYLLDSGFDVATVRDLLGHANISTTNRYLSANLKNINIPELVK